VTGLDSQCLGLGGAGSNSMDLFPHLIVIEVFPMTEWRRLQVLLRPISAVAAQPLLFGCRI